MSEEMSNNRKVKWQTGKTKCQAIENDKLGRKEYIKENKSGTIKDIIKIRLHMYVGGESWLHGRKDLDNRWIPDVSSQSEEDTTEHILGYNKGDKKFNLNDEREKEWGKIVEVYRKNKKNRSIDNI